MTGGTRIATWGMAVSGALAVAKLTVGWFAGSHAVVADGFESAADVLASGMVLLAMWIAARPPDENHPYGHGRFETLTGLGLGVVLAMTGVLIAYRSIAALYTPRLPPASYAVWPLIASIVLKSGLSAYKFNHGRRLRSEALLADASNDAVDILSGAVALLAVGLTLYDSTAFANADSFGGAAVGLIVVVLSFQVIRDSAAQLMDTMPAAEQMDQIRQTALVVPGALGVEKCFARKTGFRYHVDLHLEVDPALTVRDGHEIASRVRQHIKQTLDWVADVLVHIEPKQ